MSFLLHAYVSNTIPVKKGAIIRKAGWKIILNWLLKCNLLIVIVVFIVLAVAKSIMKSKGHFSKFHFQVTGLIHLKMNVVIYLVNSINILNIESYICYGYNCTKSCLVVLYSCSCSYTFESFESYLNTTKSLNTTKCVRKDIFEH